MEDVTVGASIDRCKAVQLVAVAAVAVAAATTTVAAHKGATGIVKERMTAMKSMGDDMKALSLMVTGKAPYDAARTKTIAASIKTHAADIAKLFPKGSISGPSEALPAIWAEWQAFIGHARSLEALADELGTAADQGKAASLGLFAKMGKTCSGCHKDFRKKKG